LAGRISKGNSLYTIDFPFFALKIVISCANPEFEDYSKNNQRNRMMITMNYYHLTNKFKGYKKKPFA
jgi:hypothetical protein